LQPNAPCCGQSFSRVHIFRVAVENNGLSASRTDYRQALPNIRMMLIENVAALSADNFDIGHL
jgi:hypothetical protein